MPKQKTLFSFFSKKPDEEKNENVNEVAPTIQQSSEAVQNSCNKPPSSHEKSPFKPTKNDDTNIADDAALHEMQPNANNINATPYVNTALYHGEEKSVVSDEEHLSTSHSNHNNESSMEIHMDDKDKDEKNEHSNNPGLSEYEKLRLRNIKRNHDRLVALGLIDPSTQCPATISMRQQPPQRKKRKKAIKIKTASSSLPVRRSTRNRNIPVETSLFVDTGEGTVQQHVPTADIAVEEVEEHFKDSPLVQYSMQDGCINHWNPSRTQHIGNISSFAPVGPRLLSPKANLALYSLDIFARDACGPMECIVGAGKSGIISIWNCSQSENGEDGLDPVISWKGHGGRWVADAIFSPSRGDLNSPNDSNTNAYHLLTAANDGKVCLWDVRSLSCNTGAPKILATTGKSLHSGGIFSMHKNLEFVCTGSKDKTIAVSTIESISHSEGCKPIFVSRHHSAKVGCVQLQGDRSRLIGSTSDDGTIAVHDFRSQKVVADIDFAHGIPHSFVWDPNDSHSFVSAGLDPTIHSWDLRNLKGPLESYHGHVPLTINKCKRIHRPCIFQLIGQTTSDRYLISGSEKSGCLSIFQDNVSADPYRVHRQIPVYSRGYLPEDCGDAGCIARHGSNLAVAVDGGEVLILEPRSSKEEES